MNHRIDEITAFTLIQKYINGWKQNDIKEISSCLSEKVVIIESHGPSYIGISAVKNWFDLWTKANSRVIRWDALSMYFCEKSQVAFCEWDFSYISAQKEYAILGASIVKFLENKISFLNEYRMTKPSYIWDEGNLSSE